MTKCAVLVIFLLNILFSSGNTSNIKHDKYDIMSKITKMIPIFSTKQISEDYFDEKKVKITTYFGEPQALSTTEITTGSNFKPAAVLISSHSNKQLEIEEMLPTLRYPSNVITDAEENFSEKKYLDNKINDLTTNDDVGSSVVKIKHHFNEHNIPSASPCDYLKFRNYDLYTSQDELNYWNSNNLEGEFLVDSSLRKACEEKLDVKINKANLQDKMFDHSRFNAKPKFYKTIGLNQGVVDIGNGI